MRNSGNIAFKCPILVYNLESGKVYRISVTGKDESGTPLTGLGDTYSFATRATVDLDVKLSKN